MASAKDTNAWVMRWFLALQDFHFKVDHRLGKEHANADALSHRDACLGWTPVDQRLQQAVKECDNPLPTRGIRGLVVDGVYRRTCCTTGLYYCKLVSSYISVHVSEIVYARLVVLETGLGLETTFSWSWSCHSLDSLWSRSCLGLGPLGLAMSRTGRAVSKGFVTYNIQAGSFFFLISLYTPFKYQSHAFSDTDGVGARPLMPPPPLIH